MMSFGAFKLTECQGSQNYTRTHFGARHKRSRATPPETSAPYPSLDEIVPARPILRAETL